MLMSPRSSLEACHASPLAVTGIPRSRDGGAVLPKPANGTTITSTQPFIRWMSDKTTKFVTLRRKRRRRRA